MKGIHWQTILEIFILLLAILIVIFSLFSVFKVDLTVLTPPI